MLSPSQALGAVLSRIAGPLGSEVVPLVQAAGRCLAERVDSDIDMPPFEKSAMDGYAVRASDFAGGVFDEETAGGGLEMTCVGESRAGVPFDGSLPPCSCVEIYTGAELPAETDAVVMIERTRREGERVVFEEAPRVGLNVSHRSEILGAGRMVFEPRRRLSAVDLSVLAAVGCDPVPVHRRARVSILTTGDELVDVSRVPGRGQIREGNTHYLRAACERLGCEVLSAGMDVNLSDGISRISLRVMSLCTGRVVRSRNLTTHSSRH